MKFRTPYDPVPLPKHDFGPSRTKQSFKKECDVNEILKRVMRGMPLPGEEMKARGLYGDFSNVPAYQDALNLAMRAEDQFMTLPADLRKRLDNDPAKFLAWVQDPRSGEEMKRYGLFDEAKTGPKDAAAAAKRAAKEGADKTVPVPK